jgi:SAM-dependent methyltransferase
LEKRQDREVTSAERDRFQGLSNVVRFNWPYYAIAAGLAVIMCAGSAIAVGPLRTVILCSLVVTVSLTFLSLLVTWYVYDHSGFYTLQWLDDIELGDTIVNLNAGFDETSHLLQNRYRDAELIVFDFYDPEKHSEPSIRRARLAYPQFPGTRHITVDHFPLHDASVSDVLAIMSAHEIRSHQERVRFFKEIRRTLIPGGKAIVVEHVRNAANMLAYNVGAYHFHTRQAWTTTFNDAGLDIVSENRITPFLTLFSLEKNGTSY